MASYRRKLSISRILWVQLHAPLCFALPGMGQEVDSSCGGLSDQGRGSGCSSSAPARIAPVVRTVCYIAAELVRLVSCVESMKPVLQSLYHRILLYPPPQHRTEAIRIMKEVGQRHVFLYIYNIRLLLIFIQQSFHKYLRGSCTRKGSSNSLTFGITCLHMFLEACQQSFNPFVCGCGRFWAAPSGCMTSPGPAWLSLRPGSDHSQRGSPTWICSDC